MRNLRSVVGRLIALVALCGLGGGCGASEGPPNLIVITLDTFRADRLAAYGNPDGLTPSIDELASRSLVFENAYTPIGTTHPSHASLFTGLYPGEHGVRFNGDPLAASFPTAAEYLRSAGYATAAFVSKRTLIRAGGLQQGFDVFNDEKIADVSSDTIAGAKAPFRGSLVNDELGEWLADPPRQPFFLWLHYFDTHSPYPLSEHSARALEGYTGPYETGASVGMFHSFGETIPANRPNRVALRALYDGQVVELDRYVGEALELLGERGLLENAVVVLTADHGQLLGAHDAVGHGFELWEPVLRVPLVIWRSGAEFEGQAAGRRTATRVSLIDLFPTLLELAELTPPVTSGRSLRPFLSGETLAETAHFASVRVPKIKGEESVSEDKRAVAVYEERWKLIVDDDGETLFDLVADPREVAPVAIGPEGSPSAAALARLRPLALMHRERERPEQDELELDPEVLEELRALGYVR